jgi:hypothetical protein
MKIASPPGFTDERCGFVAGAGIDFGHYDGNFFNPKPFRYALPIRAPAPASRLAISSLIA